MLQESLLKEDINSLPTNIYQYNNGVTNHLTPVQNIITNAKNLFASYLGVVVDVAEDNMSIKITSSRFYDEDTAKQIMYEPVWRYQSLGSYISEQGLPTMKVVTVSPDLIIVYMCPSDIPGSIGYGECVGCSEQKGHGDVEYDQVMLKESDEEELEPTDKSELASILASKNKVKAAQQFSELVSHVVELPDNYYFKAVRDEDGHESIALRCKYEKKRPFGQTKEYVKSVMNIYNTDADGIWVDGYDDEVSPLQSDLKNIIDQVLDFIGCTPGSDGCSFCMSTEHTTEEHPKEDEDTEEKSDDNKEKDAADLAKERDDAQLIQTQDNDK